MRLACRVGAGKIGIKAAVRSPRFQTSALLTLRGACSRAPMSYWCQARRRSTSVPLVSPSLHHCTHPRRHETTETVCNESCNGNSWLWLTCNDADRSATTVQRQIEDKRPPRPLPACPAGEAVLWLDSPRHPRLRHNRLTRRRHRLEQKTNQPSERAPRLFSGS
jgi:hypothetical protein